MRKVFHQTQASALEEAFFLEQDKVLIEKLHAIEQLKLTKEEIAKVSGIKNEKVLQKLVDLGITPEIAAAMAVVPLIEVAWADGHVDDKEKEIVLKNIPKMGIAPDGIEYTLIERWLTHKPAEKLLDAWTNYIGDVCHEMKADEKDSLKKEILGHITEVATASGGFLGLAKISSTEKAMIKKLEDAFNH